jgi:hypothetical protein
MTNCPFCNSDLDEYQGAYLLCNNNHPLFWIRIMNYQNFEFAIEFDSNKPYLSIDNYIYARGNSHLILTVKRKKFDFEFGEITKEAVLDAYDKYNSVKKLQAFA